MLWLRTDKEESKAGFSSQEILKLALRGKDLHASCIS